MLAPLIVFVIKTFIRDKKKAEDIIKSYYSFLDANEIAIQKKVENSIKLNKARREKQQQLLAEKRQRDLEKKNVKRDQ